MEMRKEIDGVVEWIKQYVAEAMVEGVVIGLSGGIDSAVVAELCVEALGPDRVYAVMLPANSLSKGLADDLGIIWTTTNFPKILKGLQEDWFYDEDYDELTLGNFASRLRMAYLYAEANHRECLVVGTSNKSELEIGYVTKGGDSVVDLEPLGQFYKTEVYEIAKILDIPQEIIDAKPSAGLWEGQTDEEEIGMSYGELDMYLKIISGGWRAALPDDYNPVKREKVKSMILGAYHKNHMPPTYKRR